FDGTPAALDGTLEAGDELLSVNGKTVKGATKVEVAKMIQSIKEEVTVGYNKLHADPKQGKSLDIVLKKLKHKMVDGMSSTTADALGLSRAILCNDSLIKKLQELDRNEYILKGLVSHINFTIKAYVEMTQTYKDFSDVFAEIGAHEPQTEASKAFTQFSETHRHFEKEGQTLTAELKPILGDLNTYLNKAIPDTRLTIKKYADQKFEYLSYCLKVKEMDDEEYTYTALSEPLYRVETGNYEYRLVLRCRQEARKRFAALRSDVLVKMELLDQKHVQNVATQVIRVIAALGKFNTTCAGHLDSGSLAFPIELDLSKTSCFGVYRDDVEGEDDDDDEVDPELADEATSLLTAKERAEANGLLERSAGGSYFTADDQQVVEGKITTTAANKEQNGKGPVSLIDIFGELELKSEKEENDDDDE
ncbi:PREDICTED: PRKCA-binding protein-like, partial [Rhagoletis zephyria]|uniref:PRKCA-binding protein-like n=1 Tax=Rhagoletis zephyria TaxID=28612 RepID=UPI0008112309